ncbi:MAG: Rpn family recombination-promoting nuclease/putative transposase [Bacilli bacterium]
MRKLNPMNDFIFKKLFGEENGKSRLSSLLNAILNKEENQKIIEVEVYQPLELTPEVINDKMGVLDVRAKLTNGTHVNIEVQLSDRGNIEKRALWYWGRIYNEGIKKGEYYSNLPNVISIFLLNYKLFEIPKYHSTFRLREDEYYEKVLANDLEIHFIEHPKFREIEVKNFKENKLHRWLAFLTEKISVNELKELMEMDDQIREAEKLMEYLSEDPNVLAQYTARERALYDNVSSIEWARSQGIEEGEKVGIQKGIKIGKEEGREEGVQEGIQIGREEGVQEGIQIGREKALEEAQVVMIMNLVRAKADIAIILQATELTETEVKKIIEKNS